MESNEKVATLIKMETKQRRVHLKIYQLCLIKREKVALALKGMLGKVKKKDSNSKIKLLGIKLLKKFLNVRVYSLDKILNK